MREIKFRAWDNADWTMYYNHSVCLTIDGEVTFLNKSGEWEKDDDKSLITLMQYTGLKDKNGIEIYEGDIVRWDDGSNGAYWRVAKVFWDDNEALFAFEIISCINCRIEKGYVFGGNFMYRDGSQLEIIGNIYENPELLNSEQNDRRSVATKMPNEQNDDKQK